MKHHLYFVLAAWVFLQGAVAQETASAGAFAIKGFHLDLKLQVMTMDALKGLAQKLHEAGINTLIMEWEGTYPFAKHPLIANRYAYRKEEIVAFIAYCQRLGIEVVPLQQSFGHVEYILQNYRYAALREDKKDFSQVCPLQEAANRALFEDLFSEIAATHPSKYFHIGGDETYLLGQCINCQAKAEKEGKSRLYVDHIRMIGDIVHKLGKRPVLWADIALKHPEAVTLLPKDTIFVDWHYAAEPKSLESQKRLLAAGYEVWGAAALRSHPDDFFLTDWEKHFSNIRTFVAAARQAGYQGMVMTSWSTSGIYSPVFESFGDFLELRPTRRVYPLTGFNILLAAYAGSLKSPRPLDTEAFLHSYCQATYGFTEAQTADFWNALKSARCEVHNGLVMSKTPMTLEVLLQNARAAARTLSALKPNRNRAEFEHYRLMADIRAYRLAVNLVEKEVNSPAFSQAGIPAALARLRELMAAEDDLGKRFIALNRSSYYRSELEQENCARVAKTHLLYDRLARTR